MDPIMNFNNSLLMCVGALLLCNVHFGTTEEHGCYIPTNLDAVHKFQPVVKSLRLTYPKSNSTNIFIGNKTNSRSEFYTLECSGGSHLMIESQSLPDNVDSTLVKVECDQDWNQETATSVNRYRLLTNLKRTESNWLDLLIALDKKNNKTTKPENIYAKNFADIGCSRELIPEALENRNLLWCPKSRCTTCIEIGLPEPHPLAIVHFIAIDASKLRPYLAYIHIPPAITNRQVGNNSWAMKKGSFFKESEMVIIEEAYQRDYQRKAFFEIFQDQNLVDKYIPETGNIYLTSGKLFTERDFFYTYQQRSAFFYENTMPVWNSVATGNWELAADFLRKLIAKYSQRQVRVFSGTYGTLQLRDQQENLKKIFLARGPEGERVIPVPEFLFKYAPLNLTDVSEGQLWDGLVLVTVNNPHLMKDELVKEGFLKPSCSSKPICQQLMLEFANLTRGYTYCCSVKEFEPIAKALDLRPYTAETWFDVL